MPTANKDNKSNAQNDIQEPQKLVQNLVDKKIRNLEKRKSRLQELEQLAAKGQKLESEQQKAIKKLDQVIEMIDLMKDLNKSITEVLTENTKQQKKQMKKEMLDKQIERQQQEIERLKTIIKFQDILGKFETTVRQDFSKGTNGAIKLSEDQLNHLDQLFTLTTEVSDDKIETTAEKLIALADGKSREAWPGVTFQQLKDLMDSIKGTNYFKNETPAIPDITSTANSTNKSSVVPTAKSDNSTKKFTPKDNSTNNTTNSSSSTQFPTIPANDFNQNLTQLQNQFSNSGISFMTNSLVDKDPAVVAVSSVVASVPSNFSYQFGLQTNESFITSIPDSTNTTINPQKTTNFENSSSISTIPTQTFTNQSYAYIPNPNTGFVPVPVTMATVPLTPLLSQDMTTVTTQVATDMIAPQSYGNQINSSATDKQTNANTSHNNFNDEHRNRNPRNRSDPNKKNMNGSGSRPRNPKGQNYGQNNQMFGNYNPKYDNHINGNSFGNSLGEKTSNNNFSGSRGRPQRPRQERPRTNQNFNSNYGTAAAK